MYAILDDELHGIPRVKEFWNKNQDHYRDQNCKYVSISNLVFKSGFSLMTILGIHTQHLHTHSK